MKCEVCGKETFINHGNANHIFCQNCSSTEKAIEILKTSEAGCENNLQVGTGINEYLKQNINSLFIGVGVAFFGLINSVLLVILFQLKSYYLIVFGIFFLSGVVATCTSLVIRELKKRSWKVI